MIPVRQQLSLGGVGAGPPADAISFGHARSHIKMAEIQPNTYRFTWHTTDDHHARLRINTVEGTIHRVVFYHLDSSVYGEGYDVTLEDETGADLFNGYGIGLSFNASTEAFPRFNDSVLNDGRQFIIPIISPLWLEVDAGTDETYGCVDLYMIPGYNETGGYV